MSRLVPWLLALVLLGAFVTWLVLRGEGDGPRIGPGRVGPGTAAPGEDDEARIGPYPASQFFIEHDLFLPATDPKTVSAAHASFLRDDDEVFGVFQGGQARAYPIHMLAYHHVVNDVIRGIPVAITY